MVNATLKEIRSAAERIRPFIHRTPIWRSKALSEITGLDVHVKAELFQKTGSYKPRGMLNKLFSMNDKERVAGAITFSAGNAAQGLAYAGGIEGDQGESHPPIRGNAHPQRVQVKAKILDGWPHGAPLPRFQRLQAVQKGLVGAESQGVAVELCSGDGEVHLVHPAAPDREPVADGPHLLFRRCASQHIVPLRFRKRAAPAARPNQHSPTGRNSARLFEQCLAAGEPSLRGGRPQAPSFARNN